MNEIFENLYDMTAFSNIIAEPQFLIMYAIAFVLLYLGIKKQYEPLLLVPIAFVHYPIFINTSSSETVSPGLTQIAVTVPPNSARIAL